jgi:hypothetical protein
MAVAATTVATPRTEMALKSVLSAEGLNEPGAPPFPKKRALPPSSGSASPGGTGRVWV